MGVVRCRGTFAIFLGLLLVGNIVNASEKPKSYCRSDQACWPSEMNWKSLKEQVHGKLVVPTESIEPCHDNFDSQACQDALTFIKNPFFLQTNPGDLQSLGWLNAWQSEPSAYAVLAQDEHDVVVAINFAREHNLKLAIKGAGHDYLGRSQGKDTLLIWLRPIRKLEYKESFIPQNAPKDFKAVSAISVGAGERWLNVYNEVTTKHHRYVQGGGCASVGATGGFTQGGGFGSWSKNFGTGAANVLEIKVVTADGRVLTANPYQHKDLFWALRGGGGGTFGVVTEMTLLTHPLPSNFALVRGSIKSQNDAEYKKLLEVFLGNFRDKLNNKHWGENISFSKNKIEWFLLSQGLTKKEIESAWASIMHYADKHSLETKFNVFMIPPTKMWNYDFWEANLPEMVVANTAPNADPGEFWWAPNSKEVSTFWYTYQSWWLPETLFSQENIKKTANVFYQTVGTHPFSFHIQKGLAGGSSEAISRTQSTSTHPGVFDASGLVIMAAGTDKIYPGLNEFSMDKHKVSRVIRKINKAMAVIKTLAPNAGTYANEADYFETNWQNAFWGKNYTKLIEIKRKYDPDRLFSCHHCVGDK